MYIPRVLIISIIFLGFSGVCTGQGPRRRQRNRQSSRRGNRLGGGLPSDLAQVYNAVASDMTPAVTTPTTIGLPSGEIDSTMAADDPWRRFIPSTPTASEVECHIDVKVVRRHGGRCIRVGGILRRAVCQSGMYTDWFNTDLHCERILAEREDLQNQASSTSEPEN